ncbi:unnamed protein product [Moneuplotes crassus]|uniref:Uncharacterized protein n=1 Tax=Euplotes crassus TaxID=5936 RepID=A0AAD1URW5_EUPCR|nr:unnamed protein product [Moneuplotes crassus]
MSSKKLLYGVLGVGALIGAGIGLYYLLKDDEDKLRYDPKIHTKEKLLSLFQEFEVEYADLFLHWYSMLAAKEKQVGKGNIDVIAMERFKDQITQLTEQVDEEILSRNNINAAIFDKMIEANKQDSAVIGFKDRMNRNYNRLITVQKPRFDFDFPKEITKEEYFIYLKLAYAKFRYEVYNKVQAILSQTGQILIAQDQYEEVVESVSLSNIKELAYKKCGFPAIKGEEVEKTVMKAYLVHVQTDESLRKKISALQKFHQELILQIPQGKMIQGVDRDPLEVFNKEAEYEKLFVKNKSITDITYATLESQKSLNTSEESKKNNGSFSFLGTKKEQQMLVQEFLNRKKFTPEEIKEELEGLDEEKIAEILKRSQDNKDFPIIEEEGDHNSQHDEVENDDVIAESVEMRNSF